MELSGDWGKECSPFWLNHKITDQQFEDLLKEQGYSCADCKTYISWPPGMFSASIDHDHSCCNKKYSCGKCIRGIVCLGCNNRRKLVDNRQKVGSKKLKQQLRRDKVRIVRKVNVIYIPYARLFQRMTTLPLPEDAAIILTN